MATATVNDIEIRFSFSRGVESETETESFVATDSSLQSTVDDRAEELLDDLNKDIDDDGDRWKYDGYDILDWDGEWSDTGDFKDLNEYGEYAEKVEEYGEAYHLRYADVGDFDFDDNYCGCFVSEEDYAQDYTESHHEIPSFLENYIDWEALASDLMMDHSSYDGNNGTHIFRDY